MLLFNKMDPRLSNLEWWFKYNTCYCSSLTLAGLKWFLNSNTTLVTVQHPYCSGKRVIQGYSNTALVTVQQITLYDIYTYEINSNTALVTVHRLSIKDNTITIKEFKYNTCYCSSALACMKKADIVPFKYNTCYCSSREGEEFTYRQLIFKYNTCYCSSKCGLSSRLGRRIQIQHLLLFIGVPCSVCRMHIYSNTTLVTVHQTSGVDCNTTGEIQIQHLLLFIGYEIDPDFCKNIFKYNTCYCSSHVNKGFLRNIKAQKPYIYAISWRFFQLTLNFPISLDISIKPLFYKIFRYIGNISGWENLIKYNPFLILQFVHRLFVWDSGIAVYKFLFIRKICPSTHPIRKLFWVIKIILNI